MRKFASIDQNGPKFRVLYAKKFTGLKKVHHRRLWRLWLIWAMLISLGSIKKLLRRNIKQISSLIFGMEHSLKTRLINVEARRAPSICYQCNEGPFSWNQCDLMSLKPFAILLLMLNIAHLLLQKENQKEDRPVRIPLLDDILCDILIWKGSVPMHWQRWHL